VYLATELTHDPLQADAHEFFSVDRIPVKEAFERALRGEMPDAKTLATMFLIHRLVA